MRPNHESINAAPADSAAHPYFCAHITLNILQLQSRVRSGETIFKLAGRRASSRRQLGFSLAFGAGDRAEHQGRTRFPCWRRPMPSPGRASRGRPVPEWAQSSGTRSMAPGAGWSSSWPIFIRGRAGGSGRGAVFAALEEDPADAKTPCAGDGPLVGKDGGGRRSTFTGFPWLLQEEQTDVHLRPRACAANPAGARFAAGETHFTGVGCGRCPWWRRSHHKGAVETAFV